MSWFSRGGNTSASGGGAFAGTGSSRWINMDTNQIRNFSGELTGENDAFSKMFGLELTRQQRIVGFVGCLIAGFVMSLLGSILLVTGSLATFAVLYSVGVVVSLTGTGFLLGFMKQFKQMFNKVRVAFTAAMVASFIMVWVSAFAIDSTALATVFVVILYIAFLLYSLSYIPWCIDFLKRMASKLF